MSKMVRLGAEFITLLHVAIAPDKSAAMIKKLRDNKELKQLNIRASELMPRELGTYKDTVVGLKIHVIGPDKSGMLARIAETLARRNMSIEDVTTEIRRGKGGQRNFVVNAEVVTVENMDQDNLDSFYAEFQALKEELQLSVVDIRVHM
jgi:glycine cleavage system regulatory protein